MGVRTKGKRKITIHNETYFWNISLDDDSPYLILNMASEDKKLIIACPLKTETSYIISKGTVFQSQKTDGRWERYLLPFSVPEIITPKFVSEVILWASQGKNAVKVDWDMSSRPV